MGRAADEKKGWFLIEDVNSKELEGKEIVFKAKDLADWFTNFDRWWLQVKGEKACLSHEGVSYEPYFYGKIRKIKNVE